MDSDSDKALHPPSPHAAAGERESGYADSSATSARSRLLAKLPILERHVQMLRDTDVPSRENTRARVHQQGSSSSRDWTRGLRAPYKRAPVHINNSSPPNHGHLPIPRSQSPDEVMGVLGLASNSRLPYPITRQSPSGTFGRLLEPSAPAHPSTGIVPETVVVSAPSPHRPFHSTVDASPAPTHSHNLNASLGETRRTEEGEEVLADEIMSGNPDSPAASTRSRPPLKLPILERHVQMVKDNPSHWYSRAANRSVRGTIPMPERLTEAPFRHNTSTRSHVYQQGSSPTLSRDWTRGLRAPYKRAPVYTNNSSLSNQGHQPIPRSQTSEVMDVLGLSSNSLVPYAITRQSPSGTFSRFVQPSEPAQPSAAVLAPSPHPPFNLTVEPGNVSAAPSLSLNSNASLGDTHPTGKGKEVVRDLPLSDATLRGDQVVSSSTMSVGSPATGMTTKLVVGPSSSTTPAHEVTTSPIPSFLPTSLALHDADHTQNSRNIGGNVIESMPGALAPTHSEGHSNMDRIATRDSSAPNKVARDPSSLPESPAEEQPRAVRTSTRLPEATELAHPPTGKPPETAVGSARSLQPAFFSTSTVGPLSASLALPPFHNFNAFLGDTSRTGKRKEVVTDAGSPNLAPEVPGDNPNISAGGANVDLPSSVVVVDGVSAIRNNDESPVITIDVPAGVSGSGGRSASLISNTNPNSTPVATISEFSNLISSIGHAINEVVTKAFEQGITNGRALLGAQSSAEAVTACDPLAKLPILERHRQVLTSKPDHPSTGIFPEAVIESAPSPRPSLNSTVESRSASPALPHDFFPALPHDLNVSLRDTLQTGKGKEVVADVHLSDATLRDARPPSIVSRSVGDQDVSSSFPAASSSVSVSEFFGAEAKQQRLELMYSQKEINSQLTSEFFALSGVIFRRIPTGLLPARAKTDENLELEFSCPGAMRMLKYWKRCAYFPPVHSLLFILSGLSVERAGQVELMKNFFQSLPIGCERLRDIYIAVDASEDGVPLDVTSSIALISAVITSGCTNVSFDSLSYAFDDADGSEPSSSTKLLLTTATQLEYLTIRSSILKVPMAQRWITAAMHNAPALVSLSLQVASGPLKPSWMLPFRAPLLRHLSLEGFDSAVLESIVASHPEIVTLEVDRIAWNVSGSKPRQLLPSLSLITGQAIEVHHLLQMAVETNGISIDLHLGDSWELEGVPQMFDTAKHLVLMHSLSSHHRSIQSLSIVFPSLEFFTEPFFPIEPMVRRPEAQLDIHTICVELHCLKDHAVIPLLTAATQWFALFPRLRNILFSNAGVAVTENDLMYFSSSLRDVLPDVGVRCRKF